MGASEGFILAVSDMVGVSVVGATVVGAFVVGVNEGDEDGVTVVVNDVGITVVGCTVGCLVRCDVGFVVGVVVDRELVGDVVVGSCIVYVISPPKYRG